MFDKEIYVSRREALKKSVGSGLLLFPGNNESSINYVDNAYYFRQDSTFLYFFGHSKPGLAAVIDVDNDEEIFYGDDLTIDDVIWTGPMPTVNELAEEVGVGLSGSLSSLKNQLSKAIKSGRQVHLLPPYRPDHYIVLSGWMDVAVKEVDDYISLKFIQGVLALRSIKTDPEIAEMHLAANITGRMHTTAIKGARPGMIEYELTGKITGVAMSGGGNLSFPVILTVDGQTLHNHYHGNTMKEGDLLLVDCGAENGMGYAGDMTRTIPVSGRFDQRQKEIYQIVLSAQEHAISMLRPGISYAEVNMLSLKTIATGLNDLGLMKGDPEEAARLGAVALFMPHGVGHMIGLDVHDMENLGEDLVGYDASFKRSDIFGLRSLRLGKRLEAGFAVTVEPGVYFIPDLINKWKSEQKFSAFINYEQLKKYHDFGGVRIEDDYLINAEGATLLGKPVPKTIAEIEGLKQEK